MIANLFLCSFIALLFGILLFIIKITLKQSIIYYNFLNKHKTLQVFFEIFIGIGLSSTYLVIFYLSNGNNINILTILLVSLTGIIFVGPYFSIGGFLWIFLAIYKLFPIGDDNIVILFCACYAFLFITSTLLYFLFKKLNIISKLIINQVCFIIFDVALILILLYACRVSITPFDIWLSSFIVNAFMVITLVLFIYINSVYKKSQNINIQVAHEYEYFSIADFAHYSINNFINTNNVQYAYVVGVPIKVNTDVKVSTRSINDLKQKIANAIHKHYQSEIVSYFISKNNHLFFILKSDATICANLKKSYEDDYKKTRSKDDLMYPFQQFYLEKLHHTFDPSEVNVGMVVGLYGIHNSDIHQLISDLESLIEVCEYTNPIFLLNPKNAIYSSYDLSQFHQLSLDFELSNIKIKLNDIRFNHENFIIPTCSAFTLAAFNIKKILLSIPVDLRPIMLKHIAMKSIIEFSMIDKPNAKLLIRYPIESLNREDFFFQIFLSKLRKFNISPKKIFLLLNFDYLPNDHQMFINNIKLLKKHGVNYVFNNVTINNLDIVKQIQPYFVLYREYKAISKQTKERNKLMDKLFTKMKINHSSI